MTLLKYSAAALALLPASAMADAWDDVIVVTASGFAQPRSETGQAIDIVDRERLDQLQSATIGDALQSVPGVTVAARGGLGGQTSAFLRGGNSSQTLVLIDGVRINDLTSPNGAFDFGSLMTGNIGQVEVLRGPNSIIWGSQAIGGVVNIQSLAPVDGFEGRFGAEYGAADTKRVNANIAGTGGLFEGSLGGSYVDAQGISALAGGTERDGFENFAGNGRLKVNISDGFNLDFRGYYNHATVEYDSAFGIGANALPVTRNRQFVGYVGANVVALDGRMQNRIAYTRTDIRRLGTDPVLFSFNNFIVRGNIDRAEYHTAFDVNDALTLTAGLEYERSFASTSFEGAAADVARNHVTSGFSQIIVHPLAGLTVTGGVRHDQYRDYGGQTTLGGNIAFTPNDGRTMLRATYGEGFRAPTLSEGQPPYGNPDLRPETARNFDLGFEQQILDGKALFFATYFNRRITDLIDTTYDDPAFPEGTYINVRDKVRARGAELELNADLSGGWGLSASYTYSRVRNQGSSVQRDRNPEQYGRAAIVYAPQTGRFGANLSANWVGDVWSTASGFGRMNYGNYAVVDAGAHLWLDQARRNRFGINVENLFDRDYASTGYRSAVSDAGVQDGSNSRFLYFYRGVPRTLRVSYGLSF